MRTSLRELVGTVARIRCAVGCVLIGLGASLALGAGPANASPWAEVGDSQLRSDIEILANYGLIDGVVTTWPLPWAQVSRALSADTSHLPQHVRRSLERVRQRFETEAKPYRQRVTAAAHLTNEPPLVRGFDEVPRRQADLEAGFEYMWSSTAFRLNVGFEGDFDSSAQSFILDGTYLAQEAANLLFYGGYVEQWWGPGWIGSLILSNNARAFPKVGVMRNDPKAFETPWLSWLGPWQFNAFMGILDDSRPVEDPFVFGLRVSLNPLPGLEIGASRTFMICGEGRSCSLDTFGKALVGNDNDLGAAKDPSNQLAGVDIRYSNQLFGVPFSIYGQIIGEDEANGLPSKEAGLFGATVWGGLGDMGAQWRLTTEYSDTTAKFFNSSPIFDTFYEHSNYRGGYRYHDRSIGSSLDNDTRLFSVSASLTDTRDWIYRLAYHHADLNRDDGDRAAPGGNPVSGSREKINIFEGGLEVPLASTRLGFHLRYRDDSPNTPDRSDPEVAVGAGVELSF